MKKLLVMALIGSLLLGTTGCFGIRNNNSNSKNESVQATKENVTTAERTDKETENESTMDNEIDTAIDKAKSYYAESDYENALNTLDSVVKSGNETVKELYSTYYNEFLMYVFQETENVFQEAGHIAAISKLNEYRKRFAGEESFEEKLNYYSELSPVDLTELKKFNCDDDWEDDIVSYAQDHLGNSFNNCMLIEMSDSKYADRWAEYYVNCQYVSLVGVLSLSGAANANDIGKIEIYADDELIYSSQQITAKTDPIEFSVDITGKKYIKIKAIGIKGKGSDENLILAEAKLNKY